ncbi:MAG: hypothetical protein A2Z72_00820, partial [Omnitrophica bacterium RBG_13_46_9]
MRILLTRTDRIGDVVLSTPAIKAVRDKYPDAFIAFMVRPYAKDIIDGNPYLDETIIYDKTGKHKSFFNTVKFALGLRKKRFDMAVMLHPTNRVHMVAYLAGIPHRVGYDRKLPFLLTRKIPHLKQKGTRHESEYILDLLRSIGVVATDKELFVPVHGKDIAMVDKVLDEYGIDKDALLVAVNPGASCPSKRWTPKNFAAVCDALSGPHERHEDTAGREIRIVIVSDLANSEFARAVEEGMRYRPVNLSGKTSIGELSALLSKCKLFISNDSGPVHIACAVGTPVISIFGRNDPGLSPKRWGPIGEKSVVFHKDIGCNFCLA